jgi:hypothetical protein
MMNVSKFTVKTALIGMMLLASPMARAEGSEGAAIDAATQEKVTVQLTALGYEVRKMEMEDGMLEVYAVKDGATFQLFLDEAFKIVKTCTDAGCDNGEAAEG